MQVFLNGRFVPAEQAVVSVADRGFLYGDGVFELVPVHQGRPFRWPQHWDRFRCGADYLKIRIPFSGPELLGHAGRLVEENDMPSSLLRLALSRGVGIRGYSPKGANSPTLVMTLHEAPQEDPEDPICWNLVTASQRLPAGDPLSCCKTANKLPQILARAEADAAGADEALLLNTNGDIIEGSAGNLFWIEAGAVHTPPLASGVLPGVTRAVILELCRSLGLAAREARATSAQLLSAEGVFLSLSSRGIVEAATLDGHPLAFSPLTGILRGEYLNLVRRETA